MKKVIVISTSLRRGSNSDMLADKFAFGAKSAGNDVEKISRRKGHPVLHGLLWLSTVGQMRHQGRCERHHGQGDGSRSGGMGF